MLLAVVREMAFNQHTILSIMCVVLLFVMVLLRLVAVSQMIFNRNSIQGNSFSTEYK